MDIDRLFISGVLKAPHRITSFVQESNKIEGILRKPTLPELDAHTDLLFPGIIDVQHLESFVQVVQPGAKLRIHPGMDVRIGKHIPPRGGPAIVARLEKLLEKINKNEIHPWNAHVEYETIHPFMDGNGRSGRALWLHTMYKNGQLVRALDLGFLHLFYYQTLDKSQLRDQSNADI